MFQLSLILWLCISLTTNIVIQFREFHGVRINIPFILRDTFIYFRVYLCMLILTLQYFISIKKILWLVISLVTQLRIQFRDFHSYQNPLYFEGYFYIVLSLDVKFDIYWRYGDVFSLYICVCARACVSSHISLSFKEG